jgi:hypothetical protein
VKGELKGEEGKIKGLKVGGIYNKKPASTDAKHDGFVPYPIGSTKMHEIAV